MLAAGGCSPGALSGAAQCAQHQMRGGQGLASPLCAPHSAPQLLAQTAVVPQRGTREQAGKAGGTRGEGRRLTRCAPSRGRPGCPTRPWRPHRGSAGGKKPAPQPHEYRYILAQGTAGRQRTGALCTFVRAGGLTNTHLTAPQQAGAACQRSSAAARSRPKRRRGLGLTQGQSPQSFLVRRNSS